MVSQQKCLFSFRFRMFQGQQLTQQEQLQSAFIANSSCSLATLVLVAA